MERDVEVVLRAARAQLATLDVDLPDASALRESIEEHSRQLCDDFYRLEARVMDLQREKDRAKEAARLLAEEAARKCPECGQDLPADATP